MRRAARIDANQPSVVAALRSSGCSCVSLAGVGEGVPDLLVGVPTDAGGETHLVEVKDGSKVASARYLTRWQAVFHESWRGAPIVVLESVDEALAWAKQRRMGA